MYEQKNYVNVFKKAYELLSTNGKWILAAPAVDLVKSIKPYYHKKLCSEFLRLNIAKNIAPYVYAFDIQAQGSEINPQKSAQFVKMSQVR